MTNNKKTTKRALISSVLSLVLCFAMLLGTTFAWFSDSVSSANNIITAGNLDIELYYQNDETADWTEVDEDTNVFKKNTLWEPGHAEVVEFKVVNEGSLALKYQLAVNIAREIGSVNVNGEGFMLSQFIKFAVIEGNNTYATREAAIAAAEANGATLINEAFESEITTLLPKADVNTAEDVYTDVVTMVVYMPAEVGNDANYKKGAAVPTIELGVNLFATQAMAEADSFGTDYDQGAPIVMAPIARPDSAVNLKGAEDVMIYLSDELLAALPAGVEEIGMSVSEPVVDETAKTITFAEIELIDQNGEEIDLADLNTTITVTLPAQDVFPAGDTVLLYHDGEYVATAVVNADKTISYEVAHLCEVTVSKVELPVVKGDVVEIGNVSQLIYFANDVNAGNTYEGKTVVLTADINLNNTNWTPIGNWDYTFDGNFDGQGHKIMNLKMSDNTATNGEAYLGFFGITANNTIENLVIENVTISSKGQIVAAAIAYPYYTTVKNITVCGDIAIEGGNYTAGVLAYTRHCVNASNLTVNGNDGSYITGASTVGGVISDIQINGGLVADYSNFSAANITVKGDKCVGGISGIIGGQTLNGAAVKNVTLVCSDAHVGIVSGSFDSKPVINNVTYSNVTGATAIAGTPYGSKSNGIVIIDGVEYAGNLDTFKAQLETGTVNLACDIDLGSTTITVPNGLNTTLDLNGCVISGVCNVANGSAFTVNNGATLNIKDSRGNGKISYAAGSSNQGYAIKLIGTLNLYSGTIELTGNWSDGICYAVDIAPNVWSGVANDAVFNMYGGKVVSSKDAIRVANYSATGYAAMNVGFNMEGGEVIAARDGIFMQQYDANQFDLFVIVTGGTIKADVRPIRVYGPNATGTLSGNAKSMTITAMSGALVLNGTVDTSMTWHTEGKIAIGGGMTVDNLNQYANITLN